MKKQEFDKLFDRVRKYGTIEFENNGEQLILSLFNGCFCLEVINGNVINTVYSHWNKAFFMPILLDNRR